MRPLNKGNAPTDAHGNAIVVTEYKNWRRSLIDRIGYYCVYCNQPLSHSLQVEHVVPKSPPAGYIPGDPLAWDNMLLACGPCNNAKGNDPIDAITYYLPEEHNTHLPFVIQFAVNVEHAQVNVRSTLTAYQTHKAQETIGLLELANIDDRAAVVDIRSKRRKDALIAISAARGLFDEAKQSPTFNILRAAEQIARQAVAVGFFSIWYEEFSNVPEVMQRLTDNVIIKGTAQNCFNAASGYQPIPRNPTNVADPI